MELIYIYMYIYACVSFPVFPFIPLYLKEYESLSQEKTQKTTLMAAYAVLCLGRSCSMQAPMGYGDQAF